MKRTEMRETVGGRVITDERDLRENGGLRGCGFDWKVEVCLMVLMAGVVSGDLVWTGLMIAATATVLMRGKVAESIRRAMNRLVNEEREG